MIIITITTMFFTTSKFIITDTTMFIITNTTMIVIVVAISIATMLLSRW